MEHKTIATVTNILDEAQGIVEPIFAVFGNCDLGKDVVHPGAFSKTFQERGAQVKVLDLHNKDSIMAAIGVPIEFREMRRDELPAELLEKYPAATGGAYAKVQFLMDTPEGAGAFTRIKTGAVDQWSFGYDAVQHDFTKDEEGETIRNLREVKLYEISPVLWGMNPATVTLSAKTEEEPSEDKPVETTEDYVRVRVRAPGLFEEGSFRTITISAKEGIKAVVGRLKGETTTTIQTYLFDVGKWTEERAQKWVEEHKKDWEGDPNLQLISPPLMHAHLVAGTKATSLDQRIKRISNAFNKQFNPRPDDSTVPLYGWWIREIFESYLMVEKAEREADNLPDYPYYRVIYQETESEIIFASQADWVGGNYVFAEGVKSAPASQAASEGSSEEQSPSGEAGPDTPSGKHEDTPPTSSEAKLISLRKQVEIGILEVQNEQQRTT